MEIDYICGYKTKEIFGMLKFQKNIQKILIDVRFNKIEYPRISRRSGILFNKFMKYFVYPLIVKKSITENNVKHIFSQEWGYLLNYIELDKSVINCYDLIPWVYENNHSFFWKLNIKGLNKADKIITISEYSKNDIIKHLGYPEDRIHIIYPAVDHEHYFPNKSKEILKKFNINENEYVILYVGSEQQRKNVPFLIKSFAILKNNLPHVKLIKIGKPQKRGKREENLNLISKLNLQNDILIIDTVPEADLPRYYNAADLFVYPSLYEGFGLPPLEAMACGCPVITSNTSSLPEVVGDAGIMFDPCDVDGLADLMYTVLTNEILKEDMSKKGLERAKLFTWEISARNTLKIYEDLQ
ncbi:MAG: glycosyltransferase family 1 protein [Methanosarcina sp.]|uniref:glycosyltransferase family 4 protein n=1 Tax=Methanosarcina sp. TaxID=2213 RepID=UPI00261C5456|nr:glycosyltransferase family 1 protein [Methanosarcina sp.]MDD3245396.1 glycosyltransferase family 1 protein [Methanosarcina sp.]MDD4247589.1 glycosyltransferase family 1 protein [Methanosarcina sp.]